MLAAVNALGENQREQTEQLREHTVKLRELGTQLRQLAQDQADTNARVRSIEQNLTEVKDLLVRALDRDQS